MKKKTNKERIKGEPFYSCMLYLDLQQLGREFHHSQEKSQSAFLWTHIQSDQTCSVPKGGKAATQHRTEVKSHITTTPKDKRVSITTPGLL